MGFENQGMNFSQENGRYRGPGFVPGFENQTKKKAKVYPGQSKNVYPSSSSKVYPSSSPKVYPDSPAKAYPASSSDVYRRSESKVYPEDSSSKSKTVPSINKTEAVSTWESDSEEIMDNIYGGEPDPMGDIYPVSREWRKKKE